MYFGFWACWVGGTYWRGVSEGLFGEDELVLLCPAETVDAALMLDPNLVATTDER